MASDPGFDARKLILCAQTAPVDAGPFITMGIVRATDPVTGASDVTFHRMIIQGPDEMGIFAMPGARHIGNFIKKAEQAGKPLHITVSIGNDPAVQISAGFTAPMTPEAYDELNVAGGLRGRPVELVKALTVDETAIANSEFVIEGMVMPGLRVKEDREKGQGRSMAEFTGYTGPAFNVNVVKITAITHRENPISQICIGNSEEHVSMAGIPAEAGILHVCERAMPGRVINAYAATAGGGKFMSVLQFKKSSSNDDGEQRNAGMLALTAYREMKHVIVVDEDVNIFDMTDVMWAMNTRFQANLDMVLIPGARGHTGETSAQPYYDASIYDRGITCKAIFDCTVRYDQKSRYLRSQFMELDYKKWFPGL
jgi:4-hydroxy-3-polyprenylbenzoate decarboxylase